MPGRDLDLLTTAARDAGAVALRFWKQAPKAWEKPDGSGPVTEADLAVNALLEARLRGARPDHGWLSEESAPDPARGAATATFIIDPIDGTRAFIAGEASFAISLALAINGRVTAAAVFLPAMDALYTATATGPATLNGAPITAATTTTPTGARLLTTGVSMAPDRWPGGVPAVKRTFRPSLAYRLCLVADGQHDAMLTFRDTWEWDIAAGALIAERAGARVTDRAGAPLRFNADHPSVPGVLAAPTGLHADLLSRMTVAA